MAGERPRWPPRTAAARTHMILTVPVGGVRYVVDPGFGGLAPRVPLPLVAVDSPSPDAMHCMARYEGHWVLRARKDDAIVDCWATTLDADNPIDFEVGNHYTATHPASPFVNRLTLRAFTHDGQVSVMNRDVSIVANGTTRSERLADRAALRAVEYSRNRRKESSDQLQDKKPNQDDQQDGDEWRELRVDTEVAQSSSYRHH